MAVETLVAVPIVVAGGQEHRARVQAGEGLEQERPGVGGEAVMLVEVASTQHGVDVLGLGEIADAAEGLAQCPAAGPRKLATRPLERRVEVQIGEHQQAHDATSSSTRRVSFALKTHDADAHRQFRCTAHRCG
ncbi:MAG: hypothetical protein WKF73_09315 [Nocardioidaceae bacterium]